MITDDFATLHLPPDASWKQVERAFELLSRKWHPEINASSEAEEKYRNIAEAYARLRKHFKKETKTTPSFWSEWAHRLLDTQRAPLYTGPGFDRVELTLNIVFDWIRALFVLFVFVGSPLFGYLYIGGWGILVGVLIIFLSVHSWVQVVYHDPPRLQVKELFWSIRQLGVVPIFQLPLLTIYHVWIVFTIGLDTFIPYWFFVVGDGIALGIGYGVSKFVEVPYFKSSVVWMGLGPLLFSWFLVFNFRFSGPSEVENYRFEFLEQKGPVFHRTGYSSRFYGDLAYYSTTKVILEGDAYEAYPGILTFSDYDEMKGRREVSLITAKGLFGLKVLKDYRFY